VSRLDLNSHVENGHKTHRSPRILIIGAGHDDPHAREDVRSVSVAQVQRSRSSATRIVTMHWLTKSMERQSFLDPTAREFRPPAIAEVSARNADRALASTGLEPTASVRAAAAPEATPAVMRPTSYVGQWFGPNPGCLFVSHPSHSHTSYFEAQFETFLRNHRETRGGVLTTCTVQVSVRELGLPDLLRRVLTSLGTNGERSGQLSSHPSSYRRHTPLAGRILVVLRAAYPTRPDHDPLLGSEP